jgi:hypothetical protein
MYSEKDILSEFYSFGLREKSNEETSSWKNANNSEMEIEKSTEGGELP